MRCFKTVDENNIQEEPLKKIKKLEEEEELAVDTSISSIKYTLNVESNFEKELEDFENELDKFEEEQKFNESSKKNLNKSKDKSGLTNEEKEQIEKEAMQETTTDKEDFVIEDKIINELKINLSQFEKTLSKDTSTTEEESLKQDLKKPSMGIKAPTKPKNGNE